MSSCEIPTGVHCVDPDSDLASHPLWNQCSYENGNLWLGQEVVPCVQCYIPHHCEANNLCSLGTEGPTCERCSSQGYESVGCHCVSCWNHSVPWNIVTLAVVIILVVLVTAKRGFSASLFVKLQCLAHYLHTLWLTAEIRMVWSPRFLYALHVLSFVHLNSTSFSLVCFLDISQIHLYVEWLSTACTVLLAVVVCALMDHKYKQTAVLPTTNTHQSHTRRSQCRRLCYVILTWCYFPLVKTSIQTFACSNNIGTNVTFVEPRQDLYLYDQTPYIDCMSSKFQALHLLGTVTLLSVAACLPFVISLFTMKLRKFGQLKSSSTLWGFLYEGYTRRCCFWEALVMLRVAVALAVLLVYPLNQLVQVCTVLSCTVLYAVLLIVLRPYRCCSYKSLTKLNIHLAIEICSTVAAVTLQVSGLLHLLIPDLLPGFLDDVILVILAFPLLLWFASICCVSLENQYPEIVDDIPEAAATEVIPLTSNQSEESLKPKDVVRRSEALKF